MRVIRFGVAAVLSVTACAPREQSARSNIVEIVGTDYAFQTPAKVAAGRATFEFTNRGKVRHELNISRLKPGVSIDQFLATIRADKTVQPLIEGPVGVLFAPPGGKSQSGLTVDLAQGQTYAVICIFRDSANAKRHYDLGMHSLITVGSSEAAVAAQPPTDTVIATDYAFQYPRSLAPGRHTFVMRNDGKMRHELAFTLLKKGVTLQKVQEVEKAKGDVEALFDGDLGLLHARGGQTPLGQMTMEMLPDREYVIACFFQDDDKSPEHYSLGMFGSIRTTAAPTS